MTQKRVKSDEIYTRKFVCNLVDENKSKSVINDDEILLGSRVNVVDIYLREVIVYIVNKEKQTLGDNCIRVSTQSRGCDTLEDELDSKAVACNRGTKKYDENFKYFRCPSESQMNILVI